MTGETPNPLVLIRLAINKKFNDPGEASTILANAALAQVETLAEAAQAIMAEVETDLPIKCLICARPEDDHVEGCPVPRARDALVPFAAREPKA